MDGWQERRWLRRHATLAPFGIFIATALLLYIAEQGQWQGRESWKLAATLVDFAAVLYAMCALLAERGVVTMFWALDKRREWREKMRAEMKEELREQVRANVREEVRADVREEVRADVREEAQAEISRQYQAWFERLSREKGIPLEELLPRNEDLE